MSVLSKTYFHDEAAAFAHVEALLWADGRVCPNCGVVDNSYPLKGVRSKASKKNPEGVERHGLYKCGACRKQFTVRIGTIFEETHLPMHKWLQAIHLVCSSKKGISAHQLHRTLEVQYKTAWFLEHRIREAMRNGDFSPMGSGGKVVEVDETYIGKIDAMSRDEYKALGSRGPSFKNVVLTLVERGGSARSFHIDNASVASVLPILNANLARETSLMTDSAALYRGQIGQSFGSHDYVDHSAFEWGRGDVHSNTVEGFYSIFKRGMKGVYQHCSEKHLHRYLAEFDFRYSNRSALGVEDQERSEIALKGAKGKRLTYKGPRPIMAEFEAPF
jgi:transposase-like protein